MHRHCSELMVHYSLHDVYSQEQGTFVDASVLYWGKIKTHYLSICIYNYYLTICILYSFPHKSVEKKEG